VPILIDAVETPLEFENLQAADLTSWQAAAEDPEFEAVLDRIQALSPIPQRIEHDRADAIRREAEAARRRWREFTAAQARTGRDERNAAAARAEAERIERERAETARESGRRGRRRARARRRTAPAGVRKQPAPDRRADHTT
jgi:hypothetical protein